MKKEFIDALAHKRSVFADVEQSEIMANLLDTVSSDIYSQNIRFVFELIQNADDAGYESGNEVRFDFFENALVVSHNGKVFNEQDISSLASAGKSQKENDPNATGYKGIGFKSVFGRSKRVTVFSDGYQFRFDKHFHARRTPWQIVPIWTEPSDIDSEVVGVLKYGYAVSTVIEMKKAIELQKDLDEVLADGRILLFLRKVKKVVVAVNGFVSYSIEKDQIEVRDEFIKIDLRKNADPLSNWIVRTFSDVPVPVSLQQQLAADDDTPSKLKKIQKTEISFAVSLAGDNLLPVSASQSLIFTYLPTKVSAFQFPFLVNSNFLTNAPREALHEDHPWNQWLMRLSAQKLIKWLQTWAGTNIQFQILELLPVTIAGLQGLKGHFNDELTKLIQSEAFVPSLSLTLRKTSDLIIDKTGLSQVDFVSRKALVDYINVEKKSSYDQDCFVHPSLVSVNKLANLNTLFYDIDHLQDFFLSKNFTESHTISDNKKLIRYFFEHASTSGTNEWNDKLIEIPFLFSAEGVLKAPNAICFPGISYQNDFGEGVTVIHPQVFEDIKDQPMLLKWLEQLGVKEPSEIAYIENEIIGNISTCTTEQNHIQLIRFLFRRFRDGVLTKEHLEQMQDIKIKTTKDTFEPAKLCFLSDFYQPELRLEAVNSSCFYVSPKYWQVTDLNSEWKTFFIKLGVAEKIEQTRMVLTSSEAKAKYPQFISYFDTYSTLKYVSNAGNTWFNPITKYKIESYSLLEFATEFSFSKVFWDQIFKTNFNRHLPDAGVAIYATTPYLKENFFEWATTTIALIPTKMKTCEKATDVFINEPDIIEAAGNYLPVLDYDRPLSENWRKLLNLKPTLHLENYLHILEQMAVNHEKSVISRADQKRLGLIYNKLVEMLPNLSPENEVVLSDWGMHNSLPCTSLHFEPINTLKLVNVAGFNTSTDTLKVMLLPENFRGTNTAEFRKLMVLFGIPEVNSFIPDFGEQLPRHNVSLKNKLLSIIPYFALIVSKKEYKDFHDTFRSMHKNLISIDFYVVQFARLTFQNGDDIFAGPELNTFKENNRLYFKGDWKRPLVLYALLPEILTILELRAYSEELRLLLAIEKQDIEDHFTALGLNIHSSSFLSALQSIQLEIAEVSTDFVDTEVQHDQTGNNYERLIQNGQAFDDQELYVDDDTNVIGSSFVPTIAASDESIITVIKPRTESQGIFIQTGDKSYSTMQDQASRDEVGRWSEEKVYTVLAKDPFYKELKWVNKERESGLPYDLSYLKDGHTNYIDVKGTPSPTKDVVNLSGNEWAFMLSNGINYAIYRVFNAGKELAHIEIIADPANLLLNDKIRPENVTLQI